MSDREQRLEQLRRKYGAKGIDNAARLNAHDFPEMMEWRDELDPHYAKLWLDFTYGGLLTRSGLDDRTPLLVQVRQCGAQDEMEQPASQIRSAVDQSATPP